ncbi:MAG: 4'-phosphopantetheinyl transferase superfamily protein [Ruminococcaceae bacterium]|nr:4'-phosphopantetheinyl transferase superfamily protein [Oscillospiraceae bacterium]
MNNRFKLEKTRVYISEIPKNTVITDVYPSERNDEITNTANERLRCEKYFAWQLLEYAISDCFGVKINEIHFSKNENGRWGAVGFDFSLSHSGGACAVAISDSAVGVDIQTLCAPRSNNFALRILSDAEYEEFSDLTNEGREEYLVRKWCEKEAIFKSRNLSAFIPKEIVAEYDCDLVTEILTVGDKRCFLSVYTQSACKNVEIFLK